MTNGEKILNAFPNAITRVCKNKGFTYIEVEQNDKWIADFDMEWWNAEYKEPTIKNDLAVDAVSRQAVLDLIADYDLSMGQVVRGIHALPSVTPQPMVVSIAEFKYDKDKLKELINKAVLTVTPQEPKTGHWVHGEYCSECGCDVPAYISDWKWQKDMDAKYCPNCGCRMVEPQEREDKE